MSKYNPRLEKIADDIWRGKYGRDFNTPKRRQALGEDFEGVQAIINEKYYGIKPKSNPSSSSNTSANTDVDTSANANNDTTSNNKSNSNSDSRKLPDIDLNINWDDLIFKTNKYNKSSQTTQQQSQSQQSKSNPKDPNSRKRPSDYISDEQRREDERRRLANERYKNLENTKKQINESKQRISNLQNDINNTNNNIKSLGRDIEYKKHQEEIKKSGKSILNNYERKDLDNIVNRIKSGKNKRVNTGYDYSVASKSHKGETSDKKRDIQIAADMAEREYYDGVGSQVYKDYIDNKLGREPFDREGFLEKNGYYDDYNKKAKKLNDKYGNDKFKFNNPYKIDISLK